MDKILRPRPGYDGRLTNQSYADWENSEVLQLWEYNLEDESFRKLANDLGFICKVGSARYYICPDRPGLCRNDIKTEHHIFTKNKVLKNVTYLDGIKDYKLMLDSKVKCFSQTKYGFIDQ